MRLPSDVGRLLESGARVTWKCSDCSASAEVDLQPIARRLGHRFDLRNQHPPCKRSGCPGRVTFYASLGIRSEPLRSPGADRSDLIAATYPEAMTLHAHGWRIAGGLWRPPVRGCLAEPRSRS